MRYRLNNVVFDILKSYNESHIEKVVWKILIIFRFYKKVERYSYIRWNKAK